MVRCTYTWLSVNVHVSLQKKTVLNRLIELHQRVYHAHPHIYMIYWQSRLQPTVYRNLLWLLVGFVSMRYPTYNQNLDFKHLLHETENIRSKQHISYLSTLLKLRLLLFSLSLLGCHLIVYVVCILMGFTAFRTWK